MAAEGAEGGCRQRPGAAVHTLRRGVLTGGPGAGKTAALGILRRYLCPHVAVLPEAASVLFGGGFPRRPDDDSRRAAQRAIVRVQMELEALPEFNDNLAVALCDRGTVDGAAYWPGEPEGFFKAVGTTEAAELARYDAVIFFESAAVGASKIEGGNPVRIESAEEAIDLDHRLRAIWSKHPKFVIVRHNPSFFRKITFGLTALESIVADLQPD